MPDKTTLTLHDLNELIQDPDFQSDARFEQLTEQYPDIAAHVTKRNARESVRFTKLRDMVNRTANGEKEKNPVYVSTKRADRFTALKRFAWRCMRDGNRLVAGSEETPELHEDLDSILKFLFGSYSEYLGPLFQTYTPKQAADLYAVLLSEVEAIGEMLPVTPESK